MRVLCVTHGEPDYEAAGVLKRSGQVEALRAAIHARELMGPHAVVVSVISSPRLRCLETALIVSSELARTTPAAVKKQRNTRDKQGRLKRNADEELWEDVPASRLETCQGLDEDPFAAIDARRLREAIGKLAVDVEKARESHLANELEPIGLLSVHGDLPSALELGESQHVRQKDLGLFFESKGAVAVLRWEDSEIRVEHCAVPVQPSWVSLVSRENSGDVS